MKHIWISVYMSAAVTILGCAPKDNFLKIQSLGHSISYIHGQKFTLKFAEELFLNRKVGILPIITFTSMADTLPPKNDRPVSSSGSVISSQGSPYLLSSFVNASGKDLAGFVQTYSGPFAGNQAPLVAIKDFTFTVTDFFPAPIQALAGVRILPSRSIESASGVSDTTSANRPSGLWSGIYSLLSATHKDKNVLVNFFAAADSAGEKVFEDDHYSKNLKSLEQQQGIGPRQIKLRNEGLKPGDLLLIKAPAKPTNTTKSPTPLELKMVHAALLLDKDVYLEPIKTVNGFAFRVCRFEDVLFNLAQNYNVDVNELKYFFRRPLGSPFPEPNGVFSAAPGFTSFGTVTLTPDDKSGRYKISQTSVKLEPVTFEVLSESREP